MPFVPSIPETPNPLPIERVVLPLLDGALSFTPLPDITAYELALCTTVLLAAGARYSTKDALQRRWEHLPDSAKRHWQPYGH